MAAICAICKSQFTKVIPYYGFSMDMIVSVHQLVSNAIFLTGQLSEEEIEAKVSAKIIKNEKIATGAKGIDFLNNSLKGGLCS